jgi:hypothetical protein
VESNIEQTLFLLARRSKVRGPRQLLISDLRRTISGIAVSAAAICSTAAMLGAGLPATSASERNAIYPSTTDNHQANLPQKQPAQLADLMV